MFRHVGDNGKAAVHDQCVERYLQLRGRTDQGRRSHADAQPDDLPRLRGPALPQVVHRGMDVELFVMAKAERMAIAIAVAAEIEEQDVGVQAVADGQVGQHLGAIGTHAMADEQRAVGGELPRHKPTAQPQAIAARELHVLHLAAGQRRGPHGVGYLEAVDVEGTHDEGRQAHQQDALHGRHASQAPAAG